MAGNIFINYRRDESGHVAGRLAQWLAPAFGRDKIFMDVDSIPVGFDFVEYLNSQVAACDAMVSIVGLNWLKATDENGRRRLDNPEDFVVIEIAAALARDIPVVPVLVDGARMPKASDLPDSLKLFARRNAIEVRHTNFSSDAKALVKKLREALDHRGPTRGLFERWGRRTLMVGAVVGVVAAALLLLPDDLWKSIPRLDHFLHPSAVENTASANSELLPLLKQMMMLGGGGQPNQGSTVNVRVRREPSLIAAEAEAKRKADEAERQRQATLKAEEEHPGAGAEKATRGANDAANTGPIPLNNASAFSDRGVIYHEKGDYDRAIADYTEAIRLDPKYSNAFYNRGYAYEKKGDYDRAIADYTEAIRLVPGNALAFCDRGRAKRTIKDPSADADIDNARQLGFTVCR
jgi:tetratricopeptide (TPR) repeat protein